MHSGGCSGVALCVHFMNWVEHEVDDFLTLFPWVARSAGCGGFRLGAGILRLGGFKSC